MILLQNDWHEAFRCGESAWVTFKLPGQAGVHGRLEAPSADGREPRRSDGFWCRRLDTRTLEVGHPDSPATYHFVVPTAVFASVHDKAVTSVDVTSGGLGLSCASDDTLRIWEMDSGVVRRELGGHLGEVTTCRWFPSGVVALSGGLDMQLKVWSAETGRCAATLRGHTAAVQHTAVVERGRNVVSVARDGRCKLWDVGQQQCLADLCTSNSVLNCVLLTDLPDGADPGVRHEAPNPREVATEGRLAAVGADDGSLQLLHVHSRQPVCSWQLDAAVTCVAQPAPHQLAAGCADGSVSWLDVRTGRQVRHRRRSAAAVLALAVSGDALVAARADGIVHTEPAADDAAVVSLSGPHCEPVYGLAVAGRRLFAAARDGKLRRYLLPE